MTKTVNEAERIGIAELREKLAKEIADARDSMVAEGDDIIWLFCQLVHWPHERVHPERTMSDPFIRVSAARTALALLDRIEKLEEAITPSGDTKAAYMGEFSFNRTEIDWAGDELQVKTYVPWTTIKEIMAAIRTRALTKENPDA